MYTFIIYLRIMYDDVRTCASIRGEIVHYLLVSIGKINWRVYD